MEDLETYMARRQYAFGNTENDIHRQPPPDVSNMDTQMHQKEEEEANKEGMASGNIRTKKPHYKQKPHHNHTNKRRQT